MTTCALDVGAHWGEVGLEYARQHPDIPVYAFEPDIRDAAKIVVSLDNYHVLAMAVSETNGLAELNVNQVPGCSSLHALSPEGVKRWPGGFNLKEIGRLTVPTIRLDTFLQWAGIDTVTWLKIDTQGHDQVVLRSLGVRLLDVQEVVIEVCVAERASYENSPSQEDIMNSMRNHGFTLTDKVPQTDGYEENWTFTR
ncbi:MAG: FkbM family methyltransferase [Planctomycetota bacterium]|jgi:FkbM family methyltransferase